MRCRGHQGRRQRLEAVTISSSHGERDRARRVLTGIAAFFATLRETAEQLTDLDRWYRILSQALVKYLKGRQLDPPRRLQAARSCTQKLNRHPVRRCYSAPTGGIRMMTTARTAWAAIPNAAPAAI
jgi:hypothetical protein